MSGQFFYSAANFHSRTKIEPIVVSSACFTLKSKNQVAPLRSAIEQFEEILNRRDAKDIKYEWANIRIDGLTVEMEIYWYDLEFFNDRNKAYLVGAHPFVFQRFGVSVNDVAISHTHLAAGPRATQIPRLGDTSPMPDETFLELNTLLNRFVDGDDTSLSAANRLEVLLSEMYSGDDVVEERIGDLAQYRPGGGDYLFDAKEMRGRLDRLRKYLARLSN
jgi:hypothetical protein